MQFRIGVNLGDVVEEKECIYGDGVNIAARVQSMAEAGGICISGRAYDQIENKFGLEYTFLGEYQVKNIRRPIRVYRVTMVALSGLPEEDAVLPFPDKPSIAVLPFDNMSGDAEQKYFSDGITEEIITALSRFSKIFFNFFGFECVTIWIDQAQLSPVVIMTGILGANRIGDGNI